MQPFQPPRGTVPRPSPGQIPGAGPIPGARIPGPGGPRPGGIPKPGMPGPMGIKPQIPPNIPATQPPTINAPKEEQQQPAEIPTQEPVKSEVPETKPEPLKTEPPIKGPPQLEQKPPGQPKPTGMPKPQGHPAPGFRPGAPPGVGVPTGIPGSGGPVGPSGPIGTGGPGGPPGASVSTGPGGSNPPSGPTGQGGPIGNKPPGPGPANIGGPMGNRPPGPGPTGMPGQVRPPGPGMPGVPKATPGHSDEPKPIAKKPEFGQKPVPQFPGAVRQPESAEHTGEPGSDHLVRLSESLQAMKSLRSNFQGFNAEEENEQEEEESPGMYEGGEEDDYVRVEGDDDGRGEYNDEDQQYDQEEEEEEEEYQGGENQGQYEQYEDQQYDQEEEEQNYEEEQEVPPQVTQQRLAPIVEEQAPPQVFQPKGRVPPQNVVEESKEPPQARKPSFKAEVGPPQVSFQSDNAPKTQAYPAETRREEPIHQPVRHAKESPERTTRSEREETIGGRSSEYDRIVKSEAEIRVDPNLVIRVEKLELELEKERKKNAILESEQERLISENNTLKHRNTELTARMEAIDRREGIEKTSSQADVETLKYELNRSLEECRQFSGDANRVIHETSQFREETESLINSLEEDKNMLHQQVLELKRQIDEEYVAQIESFRQRTELLEMKIKGYESNFQIVQNQLKEKTETLQKVTSLNTEIQATLSSLPKVLQQAHGETAHPPVRIVPVSTTQQQKPMQVNKTADNRSSPKPANIPPAHTETHPPVIHQQEQDKPPSRKASQQQASASTGQEEVDMGALLQSKPNIPHQTGSQIEAHGVAKPAGQDFTAPPNYRIPGKKAEPPKKQPVGFRPMTEQVQANQTEEDKRISPQKDVAHVNEERVIEEQKAASASKPITAHSIQPKAKPPQHNKNPFDEVENAENFFDNLGSSAQKPTQVEHQQQQPQYYQEQQPEVTYGGYEEERLNPFQDHSFPGIEKPASNVSSNKQSKSNLRYSQSKLAVEKENNPISVEAAENFFDQLGTAQEQTYNQPTNEAAEDFFDQLGSQNQPSSQPQPQPETQTAEDFFDQLGSGPTQTQHQPQHQAPPQPQHQYHPPPQTQAKPQPRTPVQPPTHAVPKKGKNPFAGEDEQQDVMQTSGQFQGSNLAGSFNQPPEQRPQQKRTTPPPQFSQTPIQRGRNPFGSEDIQDSASQSSEFLQSSQDSFVNRPEAQRFNQIKPSVGPVQTAPVKRVEPSKSSALKKTKGTIPASMFD